MNCDICDGVFTSKNGLTGHISTIHEGIRPFKCVNCDYCARTAYDLKKHSSIHDGNKPFKCELCNSSFSAIQGLNGHVQHLHKTKG